MPIQGVGGSGEQPRLDKIGGPQGAPSNFEKKLTIPPYIEDLQKYANSLKNPPSDAEIKTLQEKILNALKMTKPGGPRFLALQGASRELDRGSFQEALKVINELGELPD